MIGAIFGDVVGSRFEFNNNRTKNFKLFTDKCFFTDDSVMTLAVSEALLRYENIDENNVDLFKADLIRIMHEVGRNYPFCGFGGHFRIWIMQGMTEPYNSYGNGSAMRVSPVAWYASSLEEAEFLAKATAEVTHNHPEGIKGAVVTAGAVFLAGNGASKEEIKEYVSQYYTIDFTVEHLRRVYTFNETCQETVPQAMVAFFEAESFEDAIRNAISVGGDSDTLAAITGSVAEAFYGIEEVQKEKALSYLDERLLGIAQRFADRYVS